MKGGCFTRKHREILGERGSRERASGGLGVIAVVIRETDARLHGNFRTSGRRWAGLAPSRGARGSGRARGSPRRPPSSCRPRRAAQTASVRAATRPARSRAGARCPARQRLPGPPYGARPAGSGGRAGEAPAPAPHRALRRGRGAERGGGRDRPQASPLPALARRGRRQRCGPGQCPPHAAALGPAPAPPAAETAPKERERELVRPSPPASPPPAHPLPRRIRPPSGSCSPRTRGRSAGSGWNVSPLVSLGGV